MEDRPQYSPGASGSKVKPRKEDANNPPPVVQELKCNPEPFEEVWAGRKRAEIRRNDRAFRVGQLLILRELKVPQLEGREAQYTGRYMGAEVTHIADCSQWMGPAGQGFVVLSIDVLARATIPAS